MAWVSISTKEVNGMKESGKMIRRTEKENSIAEIKVTMMELLKKEKNTG